MRPLLVLVVVAVEKLEQEWMLLDEVGDGSRSRNGKDTWAMGLDQEKLVLRTISSHPNPSFHSIKCIRL